MLNIIVLPKSLTMWVNCGNFVIRDGMVTGSWPMRLDGNRTST